jgi:uncharacterized RDD family membrane protein YckC
MPDTRYNTFWRRFLAGIIDGFVLAPALALIVPLWIFADRTENGWLYVAGLLALSTASHSYNVLMHWRVGQTLGKMAADVKVVDATTLRPITFKQAVFRDSGDIAFSVIALALMSQRVATGPFHSGDSNLAENIQSFANGAWFLAELITMMTNPRRRALHDLLGHTVVVKKEFLVADGLLVTQPAPSAGW